MWKQKISKGDKDVEENTESRLKNNYLSYEDLTFIQKRLYDKITILFSEVVHGKAKTGMYCMINEDGVDIDCYLYVTRIKRNLIFLNAIPESFLDCYGDYWRIPSYGMNSLYFDLSDVLHTATVIYSDEYSFRSDRDDIYRQHSINDTVDIYLTQFMGKIHLQEYLTENNMKVIIEQEPLRCRKGNDKSVETMMYINDAHLDIPENKMDIDIPDFDDEVKLK